MKRKVRKILVITVLLIAVVAVAAAVIGSRGNSLKRINPENLITVSSSDIESLENCTVDHSLILVNTEHMLEYDLEEELIRYEDSDRFINKTLENSFIELRDVCTEKFGTRLKIMSAYRSKERQLEIYNSDTEGVAAKPGESEHETGLGLDVYVNYHAGEGFLDSDAGKYVNAECQNYGFIIRYPAGKKSITGFSFEPWHIRYVGLPHSLIITEQSITLEEYIESLEEGNFYAYGNYVISKQNMDADGLLIPQKYKNLNISPDNCGNFIITAEIY